MLLSLFAFGLATATSAQPVHPQMIGCHPQPGKVAACSTPYGQVRAQAKPKHAVEEAEVELRHCTPDPSKNRGCMRAVPRGKPEAEAA